MKLRIALFLAAAVLFWVANRAAYQGYFFDDDLAYLGWPTFVGNDIFINGLLTPLTSDHNFRAFGFLYYRFMGRTFHLSYTPYIVVLQSFHLINFLLVFVLLRRLGLTERGAVAGCLFYLFHAAVLWVYWLPQYIFEAVCCMWLLVTMLLYIRGNWLLGLLSFWLAYKTKEIAVTFPAALLAWEWFLGERRWKRLMPYFVISLNFGLQAIWINHYAAANRNYTLHFTPAVLWHSILFYSSAIFFVPLLGFGLLLLPFALRDRRLFFGLCFTSALFVPMLALPSRQESVYWYIPMVGVSIAAGVIASRVPRWAVVAFFVLWFPLNYIVLREKRREILSIANDRRWYVTGLVKYAHSVPPVKAVVYDGIPPNMGQWGVEGAISQAFGFRVKAVWSGDAAAVRQAMGEVPVAIVGYYPMPRVVKGTLLTRNELQSYVRFNEEVPAWQLGSGWSDDGSPRIWIWPRAEMTLYRPASAEWFEVLASLPADDLTPGVGVTSKVTLYEDGISLGTVTLSQPSSQALRWRLPKSAPGNKSLRVEVEPPRRMPSKPNDLGMMVEAAGYASSGR